MNRHAKPNPTVAEKRFAMAEAFSRRGENDLCWNCRSIGTPTNEQPCRVCGFPSTEQSTQEGQSPMSQAQSMPVTLLSWRQVKKATLRGFAEVRVGKTLKVSDVAVHASKVRRWAALPSRPQLDANGVALRDENHRIKFSPVVQWTTKESADAFSEAVIRVVEDAHKGDTDSD